MFQQILNYGYLHLISSTSW